MIFHDRKDAAKKLAKDLVQHKGAKDTIVVALPRGGVVLGRVVATELGLPLDIVVPRKIGHPGNEEYAIGAITETGDAIWNEEEKAAIDPTVLAQSIEKEKKEAERRLDTYRQGLPPRDFSGKTIIIIDDGIATGLTMFAAIKTVKTLGAARIIVAVPGGPADTIEKLKKDPHVGNVIALEVPSLFFAVGQLYEVFGQVEDDEVITLLQRQTV
jgi:predicted phosphoribosyltransferase